MNFLAHAVAERGIHKLVPLNPATPLECVAYDDRIEVLPVSRYFEVFAGQAIADALPDAFWSDHPMPLRFSGDSVGPAPSELVPEFIPALQHEERRYRKQGKCGAEERFYIHYECFKQN